MNRCPITYDLCGTEKYSKEGINQIGEVTDRALFDEDTELLRAKLSEDQVEQH